jgi:hypothetical protein
MREVSPETPLSADAGLRDPRVPLGVPPEVLDALRGDEMGECGVHCSFLSIEFTCMQDELRGAG